MVSPPDDLPLLTRAEYAHMLHEIAHVCLAVGAHWHPERAWSDLDIARGSLASHKSPVERLAFITSALPELAQASEYLRQHPQTRTIDQTRHTAPSVRARRVRTSAVIQAARDGHVSQWIDETITALSPDTPENRAVLSFIDTLRRDTEAIKTLAEAAGNDNAARAATSAAVRCRTLAAQPQWQGVTTGTEYWTAPPTHRSLSHPAFARAAEKMRAYRQAFAFDWQHPLFSLPARDLWQVYETWCWFQALRALMSLGCVPLMSAQAIPVAVRQDRLTLSLATGTSGRLTLQTPFKNTVLSLIYQPLYRAGDRSLSRTLQPDIAIENADGETFILDAKLKAYALPGDEASDMDQMHAYRDAILTAHGTRAVQRAWCLYAGDVGNTARPMIAYGAREASIVGALRLRPDDTNGFVCLCALLRAWLGL